MTIIPVPRFFQRNKPVELPMHGHDLAAELINSQLRKSGKSKSVESTARDIARRLIDDPEHSQLLVNLHGKCSEPKCASDFHAELRNLAYG